MDLRSDPTSALASHSVSPPALPLSTTVEGLHLTSQIGILLIIYGG
jgi:hypothetical protein